MELLKTLPATAAYDVVVIGAGGAGLSAALFAAMDGAKVLLVEHTPFVGGTTAWSAGTTWVPGTHHAAKVNPKDTLQDARTYLDAAIGEHAAISLREAFLENGAAAIARIEQTDVQYRPCPKHPDYISDLPGSTLNGRALEPLPFDARLLGDLFAIVRPPIPEFTVLGGMMVDRTDINHLLGMTGSWASLKHALKIILRHGSDRLRYPRGTRWVMGNALVGRLLYALSKQAHVTLALNTSLEQLGDASAPEGSPVQSVVISQNGKRCTVAVRGGVVLASGGFNRNVTQRQDKLPGGNEAWCPGAPGHTGVALDLARARGAHFAEGAKSHAFWAPVSLRKRADGSTAVFPHFVMDRAKPGFVTVNKAGQRFVNESTSYHLFGLAMQASASVPAYLVCDAQALKKYGIGMVRPGGKGLAPFLTDGYLSEGATLDELADKLGVDAKGLQASVAQINRYAQTGVDPNFGRGTTAYQQNIGDATAGHKNPNLGPLQTAPFYAVKLYPGDIGAATGLATDASARVLDASGTPIDGLYAVGNDMHSIMGGVYTAPGITIGPGLVFGYLAAQHAVGTRVKSSSTST
jgi:succinate dehydrogenase/fumarate reductase flavoprotein subunit